MGISRFAVVESDTVAPGVEVREFAVVRAGAVLHPGVVVHPFVVIEPGVEVGAGSEVFPGAYLGKEPKGAGALARQPVFERRLTIGEGCSIGPHAVVYYDVEIGARTLVGDGASIREQCRIGEHVIVGRYVTLNYAVRVGPGTKIMDHAWLAGNMTIDEGVFISGGVTTANDQALGARGYDESRVQGPRIRRGSSIGVGAILLPDVDIGEGAVIGAGVVVTRAVPAHTVVMGVPARHVKDVTH
jgi:acetyltransferase-like isoleucine patch superfamily enzyme